MKRVALSTLSLAMLAAAGTAHAQSSVTLYGVIDESVQFVNNVKNANGANKNVFGLGGQNLQGNRWGLKGKEDLGGGLKAIFQLENGFSLNNGTSSKMFGRQAYVGLDSAQYGTLTLGRQYDPIVDMVQGLTGDGYFGSTFATPGDVDNNDNSSRINNSIKYTSPVWSGFQFEGMYALGGVAGQTGSGQSWGAAATYGIGSFNVAAGYLKMDNGSTLASRTSGTPPTRGWSSVATGDNINENQINAAYMSAKSIGIAQAAAQYVAGPFTLGARYSNAQYKPDAFSAFSSSQHFNTVGAFVGYQLNPATLLGLGYNWTHGSGDVSNTYNQVSLGADYNLSKRTDLYVVAAYQHASGHQRNTDGSISSAGAAIASYNNDSASDSQSMVNIGIRHKF
ncbi:MAG: porin [Paraburkholderia sp.]|uniref:porin n=1 Tax=Paraburkholderia sp. TaxID=1926495 RepID=UPI0011FE99CA|nr:porin [Paraburkholderia sp.]TAM00763.1 MAG: porin [Paraburkholderia sp.]TAM28907.1 MAG: porin [Paraburkholderia sp.]